METLKLKNIIKELDEVRGAATSMISLVLSPRDTIVAANRLLTEEYGAASNIKSRVNRQSVQWAIVAAQQKLKLFSKTPKNGLVVYCGDLIDAKPVSIAFEPHKPLNTFKYQCDNHFFTSPLNDLLREDRTYGFVIIDGNGVDFYTVSGNSRERLGGFSVSLPTKTRRGGQSSNRFARLAEEATANYLKKVAEHLTANYITNDLPNVENLILAGAGDIKDKLLKHMDFDERLRKKVLKSVIVQYGGMQGLDQALNEVASDISGLALLEEKALLSKYFEHIAKETGMISYGTEETIRLLQEGAVDTLIVWEDCKEIVGDKPLLEWIAEEPLNSKIAVVSDRTGEGAQFSQGFGGIGAILRYCVPQNNFEEDVFESDSE